jgi:hypothetical protein
MSLSSDQIREKVGQLPAGYRIVSVGTGTYAALIGSRKKPTIVLEQIYDGETETHMLEMHSGGDGLFFYGRETHCLRFGSGAPFRSDAVNYVPKGEKEAYAVVQQIARALKASDLQ